MDPRCHAIDKGTNLSHHLIQAFEPGETTPEQSHEIGMKLANEVLGGKYEFVLTTHIDKGKSYIEHIAEKAGTSYKAKLKAQESAGFAHWAKINIDYQHYIILNLYCNKIKIGDKK